MRLHRLLSFLGSTVAFHVTAPFRPKSSIARSLKASVDVSVPLARSELLETAKRLKKENGVLIVDATAQETLKLAVERLEQVADPPSNTDDLIGDWTLVCSTATASAKGPLENIKGFDTSKLPFFNQGPFKDIRDLLNKSLSVRQVIRTAESDGIDRIDHVLEYHPPDFLSDILSGIPDPLKTLNINPLQVSAGKVILVHKADVTSVIPVMKTKLSLQSVVGTCIKKLNAVIKHGC